MNFDKQAFIYSMAQKILPIILVLYWILMLSGNMLKFYASMTNKSLAFPSSNLTLQFCFDLLFYDVATVLLLFVSSKIAIMIYSVCINFFVYLGS